MDMKTVTILVSIFVLGSALTSCISASADTSEGSKTSSANFTALPSPTETLNPLVGSRWHLTSLDGQKPIQGTSITVSFDETTMQGSAGCNTYGGGPDSGPYLAAIDGTLTITQTAITVMGCLEPPGILEQETKYMQVLRQAARYQLVDDRLVIFDKAGAARLEYERMR